MRLFSSSRKQTTVAQLQESLRRTTAALLETSRDLQRLKEDIGWRQMGASENGYISDLPLIRQLSRNAFQFNNSFVKDAILLLTAFCFSQGVKCPSSEDEATQAALEAFWNEPSNLQSAWGPAVQLRRSNQLLLDGDLFYLHRVRGTQTFVRRVTVGSVKQIIPDPLDECRVLGYRLEVVSQRWDGNALLPENPRVIFYRDIENTDPRNDPLEGKVPWEADAWLLHAAINQLEDTGWGVPEPATSLSWYRAVKDIMQDQATISAATARLMNIMAVSAEGDPAALQAELERLGQDSIDNSFAAGGINLFGGGITLTQSRAGTGAADARDNSRELRMAGAAGMGLPLHYLCDPENANLATAESIERPVLERLQMYQTTWADVIDRSCRFACRQRGIAQPVFDVQMPNIMQPNIGGADVNDAYDRGLLTRKRAATWWLDALNVDDPETELEQLEAETGAEAQAAAERDAELMASQGGEEEQSW